MLNRIPPTGNRISQRQQPPPALGNPHERTLLLNSGTAALAAAMEISLKTAPTTQPEVILPAYACPDLISAALYAGLKPILVDLERERPYISLEGLAKAITEHTVAVVAVNFLGIPERLGDIRKTISHSNKGNRRIVLIEDSAQWFPCSATIDQDHNEQGDLVIYSFGKGKPVSLLGGGALVIKQQALEDHLEIPETVTSGLLSTLKTRATYLAYNTIISPLSYWLLEAMPMIELGATRYHALTTIKALPAIKQGFLADNINCYKTANKTRQQQLHTIITQLGQSVIDLPNVCPTFNGQRLLRYPILLSSGEQRDMIMQKLEKKGCGASTLYPASLVNIEGIPDNTLTQCETNNADDLASRILTLPTHQQVNDSHIRMIEDVLSSG